MWNCVKLELQFEYVIDTKHVTKMTILDVIPIILMAKLLCVVVSVYNHV
jgi:hypothetical protein